MTAPIDAIVVGIPARDEEATIAACLHGRGGAAAAAVDVPVEIVVAADGCTDGTATVAESVRAAAA